MRTHQATHPNPFSQLPHQGQLTCFSKLCWCLLFPLYISIIYICPLPEGESVIPTLRQTSFRPFKILRIVMKPALDQPIFHLKRQNYCIFPTCPKASTTSPTRCIYLHRRGAAPSAEATAAGTSHSRERDDVLAPR